MSYEHAPTRIVTARTSTGRIVKRRVYVEPDPSGLGFSLSDFNPLLIAQKVQAGADRLAANIQTGVNYLQTGEQRLNALVSDVSSVATRTGAAIQGGTRGALASAATGDPTSGNLAASLTSKPALVIGGLVLTWFVFLRHPGHKGWH